MKKIIIKPLAGMTIIAFTMFSCAGTSGTATDTDRTGDQTAGTYGTETTETAGEQTTGTYGTESTGTTGEQTTGTYGVESTGVNEDHSTDMNTGQNTRTSDAGVAQDREMLSNEPVNYGEILEDVENSENYDVLELARMDENLSVFVQLIEQAGLEASFEHLDEFTALIPSNQAFQDMSQERYQFLTDPQNKNELRKVLQAHIIPSEVPSVAFNTSQRITTPDGDEIDVTTDSQGTVITVGGAQLVKTDINASNGIIHVVDAVIDPSEGPGNFGPMDE